MPFLLSSLILASLTVTALAQDVARKTAYPIASSGQDAFFNSNGLRIHYVDRGMGEPIVLVHGLNNSIQDWVSGGVVANLSKDFRVIALDLRGHGFSEKPHDPKQYGREMGLDIVRLLDHLQIRKAHIIGYSMGAQITAQLLTTHAGRFISAILGGGGGEFVPGVDDQNELEKIATEYESDCISRTIALGTSAPQNRPSEEELAKRSAACFADPNRDRFVTAAAFRAWGQRRITKAEFAAVKVPTLGIVGDADPAMTMMEEMQQIRPELKLVVIDGAIHQMGLERGATRRIEFVNAVREFVLQHKGRSEASGSPQ